MKELLFIFLQCFNKARAKDNSISEQSFVLTECELNC